MGPKMREGGDEEPDWVADKRRYLVAWVVPALGIILSLFIGLPSYVRGGGLVCADGVDGSCLPIECQKVWPGALLLYRTILLSRWCRIFTARFLGSSVW